MKTSIKTTISIIVIALSSISLSHAGQNRHDRGESNYEKARHTEQNRHQNRYKRQRDEHQYRHNERRSHWKHARRARHHYREHRSNRRHFGSRYERSHRRHTYWKRDHGNRHNTYRSPRTYSSSIVVSGQGHSNNILPVIAGGLIGSSIANNASHGDPGATFGGAIFGALVGNAIARH